MLGSNLASPVRHRLSHAASRTAILILLAMIVGSVAGCDRYPRDPQHSLERALARDTLRIGIADSPPWVVVGNESAPGGAEGTLLAEFAAQLGVEVDWHRGGAQELLEALSRYELDIVAGGLSMSNPWISHVGFTLPYYTSRNIVGSPDPPIDELAGVAVTVRPLSGLRGTLEERGAAIRVADNLREVEGVVAGESWEVLAAERRQVLEDLGETDHVLAVPPGENALLMRLEEFLHAEADSARVLQLLSRADIQ